MKKIAGAEEYFGQRGFGELTHVLREWVSPAESLQDTYIKYWMVEPWRRSRLPDIPLRDLEHEWVEFTRPRYEDLLECEDLYQKHEIERQIAGPGGDVILPPSHKPGKPYRKMKEVVHNVIAEYLLENCPIVIKGVRIPSIKTAKKIDEILAGTGGIIKTRGERVNVTVSRFSSKTNTWKCRAWTARRHARKYSVMVRPVPSEEDIKRGIDDVDKLDVKVSCSCMSFHWWGPSYHAQKEGYLFPDYRPPGEGVMGLVPRIRDPGRIWKVCKHLVATLEFLRDSKITLPRKK